MDSHFWSKILSHTLSNFSTFWESKWAKGGKTSDQCLFFHPGRDWRYETNERKKQLKLKYSAFAIFRQIYTMEKNHPLNHNVFHTYLPNEIVRIRSQNLWIVMTSKTFFPPTYGKFAVQCDWNSMLTPNIRVFLKILFFWEKGGFFTIFKHGKIALECVSRDIIS